MLNRNRAFLLKRLRVAGAVLGIVIILGAGATWWVRAWGERELARAEAAFLEEVGPLEAQAWAPGEVAEAENATLLLRRGAEAIELGAKDRLLMFRLGGAEPEEWSPGDRQQLQALVARLEPPLRLRRSAVTLPRSSFNIDYASVDIVPDPDLMLTITAARFQGLAARLAALDGNCDAAVVHARVLAREALTLAVEPWIFFRILAVEAQRMLLDVSLDVVRFCDSSPGINDLAAVLASLNADWPPLRNALAGEALIGYQSMSTLVVEHVGWYRELIGANGLGEVSYMLDLWRELANRCEQPFDQVESFLTQELAHRRPWNLVARILMPNIADAIQRAQATTAAVQLATLALTVRALALEDGSYPESLDRLSRLARNASYVEEVVRYQRLEDGGVVLALDRSAEFWAQRNPDIEYVSGAPPFRWELERLDPES